MTKEIARRLSDAGAWGTVVVDEDTGGGGITPVACLLEAFPIDAHDAGSHPCDWTRILDNPGDFNVLSAIPDGLGLTFAFDGSSATITTTEAGTWAFSLSLGCPSSDATWNAVLYLDANMATQNYLASVDFAGVLPGVSVAETVTVPSGYAFAPSVVTAAVATNDPFNVDVLLNVVRFA